MMIQVVQMDTEESHFLNVDAIDAMKPFEGGTAIFTRAGQRLNVREDTTLLFRQIVMRQQPGKAEKTLREVLTSTEDYASSAVNLLTRAKSFGDDDQTVQKARTYMVEVRAILRELLECT